MFRNEPIKISLFLAAINFGRLRKLRKDGPAFQLNLFYEVVDGAEICRPAFVDFSLMMSFYRQ